MSYRGSNPRRSDRLSGRSYLVGEYFSFTLFRYHSIFSTSFLFIGVSFFTATCTVCDSSDNTLKKMAPRISNDGPKAKGGLNQRLRGQVLVPKERKGQQGFRTEVK